MFKENEMRNTIASIVRLATMCLLSLALLAGRPAVGREYWVSTTGNDADAGTSSVPPAVESPRTIAPIRTHVIIRMFNTTFTLLLPVARYLLMKTERIELGISQFESKPDLAAFEASE